MKVQPTTKELIAMLYERLPELFDREAPVQEPLCRTQSCVHENSIGEPCRNCTNSSNFLSWDDPPAAPVQECFWKREGYKECPAAQRQWVGLTEEERAYLYKEYHDCPQPWAYEKAIEAKLKEKNT